jgi:hypothetical protein
MELQKLISELDYISYKEGPFQNVEGVSIAGDKVFLLKEKPVEKLKEEAKKNVKTTTRAKAKKFKS